MTVDLTSEITVEESPQGCLDLGDCCVDFKVDGGGESVLSSASYS